MTPAQLKATSLYAELSDLLERADRDAARQGPEAKVAMVLCNLLHEARDKLEPTINRLCNGRELDVWAKAAPTSELLRIMATVPAYQSRTPEASQPFREAP